MHPLDRLNCSQTANLKALAFSHSKLKSDFEPGISIRSAGTTFVQQMLMKKLKWLISLTK
jgi:hypothetical protein